MNPLAHGELAWLALAQPFAGRRERALITWAGVLPDLDGLTLLALPFDHGAAYETWHHVATHSLWSGLLCGAVLGAVATKGSRLATGAACFAAFHLHLLCDLMGSGAEWPIHWLWPLGELLVPPFSWGWELSSWQNALVFVLGLVATAVLGITKGRTWVEAVSATADAHVVATFRKWAGRS